MIVLLVLAVILAIRIPDNGHSTSGTGHRYPAPKPTMPTEEDAQQQTRDLEQWRKAHSGSDPATFASQEAAKVIGGD